MEVPASMHDTRLWLVTEWSETLCSILASMADERPSCDILDAGAADRPSADGLILSQCFACLTNPAVWLVTPEDTCIDLGRRILEAAGLKDAEIADFQNTYLEVLNQSMSALGQSLGHRLGVNAAATEAGRLASLPAGEDWVEISLKFGDTALAGIRFAASKELLQKIAVGPASGEAEKSRLSNSHGQPATETESDLVSAHGASSRTFELLLDVALPVSISFGRTFLPIKEVLKLNSGSIVELDSAATDPVEVIVNNCVIARGEVVVIDGNYGVRIQQIASRYDRLRTGTAAKHAHHAAVTKG